MDINAVASGARDARLVELISHYEKDVLRMCYAYLRDIALAEDAVQETFIKVYKHMDSFRGDSSEKTWIIRIAINVCKNIRKGAWYRFVDRKVSMDQVCVAARTDHPQADKIALTTEIMRLPRKYMEVVLLYYYEDLDASEIALALSITTQAVYLRLKRARAKLKCVLEGGVDDEK